MRITAFILAAAFVVAAGSSHGLPDAERGQGPEHRLLEHQQHTDPGQDAAAQQRLRLRPVADPLWAGRSLPAPLRTMSRGLTTARAGRHAGRTVR